MSYYRDYLRRMVGGVRAGNKRLLKPGQICTFRYNNSTIDESTSRRKFYRIIFVLNTWKDTKGLKLHALSLENIPWTRFREFIKRIIITDTLSLLKRRYEIKSPISELINRPRPFYDSHVKKLLSFDCYRTYTLTEIKNCKVGYLNFSTLFSDYQKKDTIIRKTDNISDIKMERSVIEKKLNINLSKIDDKTFRAVVIDRFGSVDNFLQVYKDLEEFINGVENKEQLDKFKL